jgi:hypothetical protein
MSGHQTKLIYDGCTYLEKLKTSTTPLKYNFFSKKFENDYSNVCSSVINDNDPYSVNKSSFCMPCKPIGDIKNNFSSISKRVDLESSLKLMKEPATMC